MDKNKKADFVRRMGRKPFKKGGLIKRIGDRHYFDDGGSTTLSGPSSSSVSTNAVNPNTGVLGSVGGALGLNDNFQAGAANIQAGTNTQQLNNAYTGAQGALTNNTSVANTVVPTAQTGVSDQNASAAQDQAIMNGTGPNPALATLNQQTNQNVNNQAALMAGQRGASGNVGLMARQIAQQGAATQQSAVGQAATNQATQQLTAGQNLANLGSQQVSQAGTAATADSTAQQNEQSILQNANTAYNNAGVGMQSNINNVNAQTAAANQQQAGNILGGVGSAVSSITGGFLAKGGVVEPKEDHIVLAEMNAAAIAHGKKNFATGGSVDNNWAGQYMNSPAQGGPNVQATPNIVNSDNNTSFSDVVNGLKAKPSDNPQSPDQTDDEAQEGYLDADAVLGGNNQTIDVSGPDQSIGMQMAAQGGVMGHFHNYFSGGEAKGKVPAMVSPGEIYLSPENVKKVITEGKDPAKLAKKFPGKAKVKGDSLKNDDIPKTLEEGGVVIDRKNMKTKEKRELFVHKAIARSKAGN